MLGSKSMAYLAGRFRSLPMVIAIWSTFLLGGHNDSGLSDTEFQELSLELSEQAGFFPTDNLLSNETSYLHVVPALRQLPRTRRAYVGVGPEQNFTYIAHSRPAIAFIVDIRRDARLLHLYYKQLFSLAENRWEYLSLLFGKPLPTDFRPRPGADTRQLVLFFSRLPGSSDYFEATFEEVWNRLRSRFPLLVTEIDRFMLLRIASAFFREHLALTYRMGRRTVEDFPTLAELMVETDLEGRLGHYLNGEESFRFLRQLQLENRLIPLVGDFAGRQTVRRLGEYLRKHDYTVSVFYFSNVEYYLFRQGVYPNFVENLKAIPFDDESLVVRSFFNFWYGFARHPEAVSSYYVTSLAQKARSLLELNQDEPYLDYWDLVTRDYLGRKSTVIPVMAPR